MSPRKFIPTVILLAWGSLILDLALLRFPSEDPPANLVPFRSILHDWRAGGRAFLVNFVGNVVAFVPMGLLPPLIRPGRVSLRHVLLFGLSLSFFIEVTQFASGRRVADADDLTLNTAGGLLGYLGFWGLRGAIRKNDRGENPRQRT